MPRALRIFSVLTALAVILAIVTAGSASAGTTIPKVPGVKAAAFTPRVIDDVNYPESGVVEYRQARSQMYAGGEFRTIESADRTTTYTRYGVFSFNAKTGAVTSWAPVTNGEVWAMDLSPDSRYLYIGGTFTSFDGVDTRLVKIDTTTNTVVSDFQAPALNSRIYDIQYVGDRLLIGGRFSGGLLALDPVTGAADPGYFAGTQFSGHNGTYATQVYRMAVNPAKTHMVVIGSFDHIGGKIRRQAAVIDLGATTAKLNPWYSSRLNLSCSNDLAWYTRGVDWSPDGKFFVLANTGGPGASSPSKLCDSVSRWEAKANPDAKPTWVNFSGGDTFHSAVITNKGVFVSGHFRWVNNPKGVDSAGPGAVSRQGLAALNSASGQPLSWNPTKSLEGGKGGYVLYFTKFGLWVGSYETTIAHSVHEGIGFLPY